VEVEAPGNVERQRQHTSRIEASVGGHERRITAHEQARTDDEDDSQGDFGDHERAE
jgi:hypothetical protein